MQNCQKIQQKCPHAGAYAGGRRCAGGAGRCARALAGGCVCVRRGARHPLRYGGGIGQAAGFSRCRASGRRVLAGGEGCGAGGSGRGAGWQGVRVSILYGMGGRGIGAAPISQGTPSPGRRSILYGSKVAPGSWSSGRPEQVQQGGGAVVLQGAPHGHRGRADLPGRRAGCDPRSSGRRCCPVCAGSMPGTGGGCAVPAADVPAPRVQPEPFQII